MGRNHLILSLSIVGVVSAFAWRSMHGSGEPLLREQIAEESTPASVPAPAPSAVLAKDAFESAPPSDEGPAEVLEEVRVPSRESQPAGEPLSPVEEPVAQQDESIASAAPAVEPQLEELPAVEGPVVEELIVEERVVVEEAVVEEPVAEEPGVDEPAVEEPDASPPALPRMIELGSDSCASCKAMIPVLAELREAHAGKLQVDFIDVWKHPDLAKPFGIRVIPTQIFLTPTGEELFRHEGFFPAAKIRERWSKHGYSFPSKAVPK